MASNSPGSSSRLLDRLPGDLLITVRVQGLIAARRLRHPVGERQRRDDVDVEQHVGKAVTAEMRRQALKITFLIGAQVEPGDHAVHGVDHAAELGGSMTPF